jgi:thymidylate synthase
MLQFMLGTFDIEQIAVVAPNAKLELFTGQSSYGPRTIGQFERVIDELNVDRDSRRAVVLIADPRDIKETIPCTIAMQFQIVNNQTEFEDMNGEWLRMTVTMRSSDTVWGLPYDIIQFGGIALAVANCVHARPAHVVVNIGNSHVYKSTKLEGEEFEQLGSFVIPRVVDTWDKIHLWATTALAQLLVNPKQFIELAIRR